MLEGATGSPDRRRVWAFPRTDNTASNRVARDAGFRLIGETDSEYPKGVPIRVNEWVYDTLPDRR
jgi:RimJ/RimL family protein N-acetyltransferase